MESKTPRERWLELRGRPALPTIAEIDAIDSDTPWSEVEPTWWIEMMQFRKSLVDEEGNDDGK